MSLLNLSEISVLFTVIVTLLLLIIHTKSLMYIPHFSQNQAVRYSVSKSADWSSTTDNDTDCEYPLQLFIFTLITPTALPPAAENASHRRPISDMKHFLIQCFVFIREE